MGWYTHIIIFLKNPIQNFHKENRENAMIDLDNEGVMVEDFEYYKDSNPKEILASIKYGTKYEIKKILKYLKRHYNADVKDVLITDTEDEELLASKKFIDNYKRGGAARTIKKKSARKSPKKLSKRKSVRKITKKSKRKSPKKLSKRKSKRKSSKKLSKKKSARKSPKKTSSKKPKKLSKKKSVRKIKK